MDAIRADDKDVAVQALKMSGFNIDEQLQAKLPLNNNRGGAYYYADAYVGIATATHETHWLDAYVGDTALHLCVRNSRSEVARLLLQNGAQTDIQNCRQESPKSVLAELVFQEQEELY